LDVFISEPYLLFLFIKFTIIFTIVSFSSDLLTAIINVKATNVLSAIRFSPFSFFNIPFFQENIEIRMLQSFYFRL